VTTILLGPQRFTMTVRPTLRSLDVDGPVAMVNSGWEEREADDGELNDAVDGRGVNLRLYQRAIEVLTADRSLRAAVRDHREAHAELRAFYGIRLQSAWEAVFSVHHRTSKHRVVEGALRSAMQALRDVDDWYAYEVARLVADTSASPAVRDCEPLAQHRAEVASALSDAAVVVVAGGHVGILMETLRLLDVSLPLETPVIAWSAGAMAVCDPVVLFHDFAPHGVIAPEVHDRGLARLRGVIPLPHARRRLVVEDRERMAVFAQRFPAHALVPLDDGTIVRFPFETEGPDGRTPLPEGARHVSHDGTIVNREAQ